MSSAFATAEDQATAPAPQGRACERCGAPVEPLDKFCPGCGGAQVAPLAPPPSLSHIRCQSCGAEVAVDPQRRSYTCPFCDSTYVVDFDPAQSGRQEPEFVIGFAIAPAQAQEKFQRWISSGGWFRPGDLPAAEVAERLRGVYLPCWSFSLLARSRWSVQIGEHWYRTETYTTVENGKTVTKTRQVQETEWWDLRGRHHRYYSFYLVSGSKGLAQGDFQRIEPFQLPALKRYDPSYLAGWSAEEYSVGRDEALMQSQQEFARREQAAVERFLPGDTHRSLEVQTDFADVNSDLILLPVYVLSYRYRNKVYRFLLNGQTGKLYGKKPLSWRRIALAALALVALAVIVWLVVGNL